MNISDLLSSLTNLRLVTSVKLTPELLLTVSVKIAVFWVVMPCSLLSVEFMESELVMFFIFQHSAAC
jgi:hypothetical protein